MLTIGSVLQLELKYSNKIEHYKCRLVDQKGDVLFIDYPINTSTNRSVFLLDGTQLNINLVEGESAYRFDSEVIGRVKEDIPMIKLLYPGNEFISKVQRRQFVRVEAAVDVAIHPFNREFNPFTAVTEDISAGGALVYIGKNNDLKQGMNIRTLLAIPLQNNDFHYLDLSTNIMRVIYDQDTNSARCSLQFDDMTPHERRLLLRLTFERQLELKKKGLWKYE